MSLIDDFGFAVAPSYERGDPEGVQPVPGVRCVAGRLAGIAIPEQNQSPRSTPPETTAVTLPRR